MSEGLVVGKIISFGLASSLPNRALVKIERKTRKQDAYGHGMKFFNLMRQEMQFYRLSFHNHFYLFPILIYFVKRRFFYLFPIPWSLSHDANNRF